MSREGWERRFVSDPARAAEMTELYRQLGYETAMEPLAPSDLDPGCADCLLVGLGRLRVIYTRPRAASRHEPQKGPSMPHPIDHLLDEHRAIMNDVAALRAAVEDLRRRGKAALPAALPSLRSVGRMMATRLLRHARKEDEALFPAIERALGTADAPTALMRREHGAIHEQARLFRATLHELEEVEHPAIVAGGAELRRLSDGGGGAAALAETGAEIVSLLDLHFGKEEEILFPMARDLLSDEELDAAWRRMEAIEAEAVR